MRSKSLFASRTFWFNLLTIVIGVAMGAGYTPDKGLIDSVSKTVLVLSPLVNIVLRVLTTKEVRVW